MLKRDAHKRKSVPFCPTVYLARRSAGFTFAVAVDAIFSGDVMLSIVSRVSVN